MPRKRRIEISNLASMNFIFLCLLIACSLALSLSFILGRKTSNKIAVYHALPSYNLLPDLVPPSPRLVCVLVMSTANQRGLDSRMAIRHSWAQRTHVYNATVLFAIGKPDKQLELLKEESLHFHDVIQINTADEYSNLVVKVVSALQFVHEHTPCSWVLKTDHDVLVNLPLLSRKLKQSQADHGESMQGWLISGAKPVRNETNKYYVSENSWKPSYYPDYLSGTAYLIPTTVSPKLVECYTKHAINGFTPEDIFLTGVCAQIYKIQLKHRPDFGYQTRPATSSVLKNTVITHDLSSSQIYSMWKNLKPKQFPRTDIL